MKIESWIKRSCLFVVALSLIAAASSASAHPRRGGWNGAGEASWDSRFDWDRSAYRSAPQSGRSSSESWDSSAWDPFRRLNSNGAGWNNTQE
jgi:hypothetical protein